MNPNKTDLINKKFGLLTVIEYSYTNNCRWATMKEQANNKRNNHLIEYNGEIKTLTQWAEKYNISTAQFLKRFKEELKD